MAIRAKQTHPLHKKMEELFQKMEELGLTITIGSYSTIIVTDRATGEEWYLRDADSSQPITDMPGWCEYKLVKDD